MSLCEGFSLEVSQPIRCRDPQSVRRVDYWESENQPLTLINWWKARHCGLSLPLADFSLAQKRWGLLLASGASCGFAAGSADDAVHLGDRRPAGGWVLGCAERDQRRLSAVSGV